MPWKERQVHLWFNYIISYEKYFKYGLIRTFIYSKDIDYNIIRKLFNNLINCSKEDGIEDLISFINEKETKIFSYLGFNHYDENKIYIGENKYSDTSFKKLKTYIYNIS